MEVRTVKDMTLGKPSNGRHFLQGLYARHHARRFRWLSVKIAALQRRSVSILELGCFDAKTLDYVPVNVHRYLGFDAGWRSGIINGRPSGLEAARIRFAHNENYSFVQSVEPADMTKLREEFDVGICMETFEYLEPSKLESYISAFADRVQGCLLATMPNEKGVPLLFKALGSEISGVNRSCYTGTEFANALLGRMERVPRAPRSRKGFDYAALGDLVKLHFRYVRLEGIDFPRLPQLSLNVGLIASQKPILQSSPSMSRL